MTLIKWTETKSLQKRTFFILCLVIMATFFFSTQMAFSSEENKKDKKLAPHSERNTNLNFEDNIVEGMNKQPLDSLNELSDGKGGPDDNHLYRKRRKFEQENAEEIRMLRYLQ